MRKRLLVAAAIVLAVLGALAIRVVVEGRGALAEGDALVERGRPLEAIRAYETSARWDLPLAPHVDAAYHRLRALTSSGEPGVALAAWRSIRAAARATAGVWTPHEEDLAAADAAIAKLSAANAEAGPSGDDAQAREAWYRSRLARDGRPRRGAALLAALGIVLWVAGAVALARRGVEATGSVNRRAVLIGAAMVVVGLACWAVGLYKA